MTFSPLQLIKNMTPKRKLAEDTTELLKNIQFKLPTDSFDPAATSTAGKDGLQPLDVDIIELEPYSALDDIHSIYSIISEEEEEEEESVNSSEFTTTDYQYDQDLKGEYYDTLSIFSIDSTSRFSFNGDIPENELFVVSFHKICKKDVAASMLLADQSESETTSLYSLQPIKNARKRKGMVVTSASLSLDTKVPSSADIESLYEQELSKMSSPLAAHQNSPCIATYGVTNKIEEYLESINDNLRQQGLLDSDVDLDLTDQQQ